ncbi:heterokaryon incompatibility protein-domain-containing protein, partial [Rhypophila decipiens]
FIGDDNSNLPPFAILSHTWEDDEVSLQDLSDPTKKCINQRGFFKIKSTCNLAARHGFKYTWVDTCCIDKQASAELSEAINSMFYWYEKAAVCYVYLSDLTAAEDDANLESALRECRWFGRGWTLQELIAPANVRFYDRNWTYIGDKSTLSETISSITNIPVGLLRRERQLSDFSVACRMSWAAKRKTTRVEDMAYCLLGIFEVNMPLIYGEREKAFSRLQQQVLQATGDLSILAWTNQHPATREYSALLAECPSQFAWCSGIQIKPHMSASRGLRVTPLEIELRTGLMNRFDGSGQWFVLDLFSSVGDNSVGVALRRYRGSEYVRWRPDSLVLF